VSSSICLISSPIICPTLCKAVEGDRRSSEGHFKLDIYPNDEKEDDNEEDDGEEDGEEDDDIYNY
tara:strand:- start:274 stop:468 length:195 start_codon:yes stop_codon:yes gene_type:complete